MQSDHKTTRRDDRINSTIEVDYSDGIRFFKEKITDLSVGGCQIETLTPLKKGTGITLTIITSPPIKLKGNIRWTKKSGLKHKMGVQFTRVTQDQERRIRDVIQAVFWSGDKFIR